MYSLVQRVYEFVPEHLQRIKSALAQSPAQTPETSCISGTVLRRLEYR